MKTPLISIITSTYNSDKTLEETMCSVLNQTYNQIEYIIVDGNSTDKTVDILKKFEQKFKNKNFSFTWISEPDNGIYDAWNKALKLVKGDWLVFIGSDDEFKTKTIIKEVIPILNDCEAKQINYVYGKIEHVNYQKKLIEIAGKPWDIQKDRFCYTMNLGHSGCFNHKNLFKKHGKFDDSFKIAGDYEFLLRELKNSNNSAFFIDKVLILMREGGVSASLSNRLTVIEENYKARELNGITTFSKELFFWKIRVKVIYFLGYMFGYDFAKKLADVYRKIVLGKEKRWSK